MCGPCTACMWILGTCHIGATSAQIDEGTRFAGVAILQRKIYAEVAVCDLWQTARVVRVPDQPRVPRVRSDRGTLEGTCSVSMRKGAFSGSRGGGTAPRSTACLSDIN
jgi:hypothetical protein